MEQKGPSLLSCPRKKTTTPASSKELAFVTKSYPDGSTSQCFCMHSVEAQRHTYQSYQDIMKSPMTNIQTDTSLYGPLVSTQRECFTLPRLLASCLVSTSCRTNQRRKHHDGVVRMTGGSLHIKHSRSITTVSDLFLTGSSQLTRGSPENT